LIAILLTLSLTNIKYISQNIANNLAGPTGGAKPGLSPEAMAQTISRARRGDWRLTGKAGGMALSASRAHGRHAARWVAWTSTDAGKQRQV